MFFLVTADQYGACVSSLRSDDQYVSPLTIYVQVEISNCDRQRSCEQLFLLFSREGSKAGRTVSKERQYLVSDNWEGGEQFGWGVIAACLFS